MIQTDQHICQGDATCIDAYAQCPAVDLILTDPPFPPKTEQYKQIREKNTITLDAIPTPSAEAYPRFWEKCLQLWQSRLKSSGWLVFKTDDYGSKCVFDITCRYFDYVGDVIWDKVAIGLGYYLRKQHEVICIYRPKNAKDSFFRRKPDRNTKPIGWHGGSKGHAFGSVIRILRKQNGLLGQQHTVDHINQTPISLWYPFVEWLCPFQGLVLDPFAGTGSIGIACIQKERKYYGIELLPHYVKATKVAFVGARSQKLTPFLRIDSEGA